MEKTVCLLVKQPLGARRWKYAHISTLVVPYRMISTQSGADLATLFVRAFMFTLTFVTGTPLTLATLITLAFGEKRPFQTRLCHRRAKDIPLREGITRKLFHAILEQLPKKLPHLR